MDKGRPLGEGGGKPFFQVIDYLAGGAMGAIASHVMAGGAEPHGRVGLFDRGHQVSARVDEGSREVVIGWGCIAGLLGALTLGVWGDEAILEALVALGHLGTLSSLDFVGLATSPGGVGRMESC